MTDLKKDKLRVGHEILFTSGNYKGLTGIVIKEEYNIPDTPYGLRFTVLLSNGKTGYIMKAEHWKFKT